MPPLPQGYLTIVQFIQGVVERIYSHSLWGSTPSTNLVL